MAPRRLYALGVLLCALVLLSSTHVAAGEEPTAASNAKEQKMGDHAVDDNKHPPQTAAVADPVVGENKSHPPCRCCSNLGGRCVRCCAEGEEAPAWVKAEGAEPQD